MTWEIAVAVLVIFGAGTVTGLLMARAEVKATLRRLRHRTDELVNEAKRLQESCARLRQRHIDLHIENKQIRRQLEGCHESGVRGDAEQATD